MSKTRAPHQRSAVSRIMVLIALGSLTLYLKPLSASTTDSRTSVTLTQLATSPALPAIMFASVNVSPTLAFSTSGGQCWQGVDLLPAHVTTSSPIALVPRTDGSPRFLAASNEHALYRSGDFGQSWYTETLPIISYCDADFEPPLLVSSPGNPQRLYAVVNGVCPDLFGSVPYAWLFTSADSGVNWHELTPPGRGSPFSTVTRLVASPILPERLYLRVRSYSVSYPDAWYRTDDHGQSWTAEAALAGDDELVPDALEPDKLFAYTSAQVGYRLINNQRIPWLEAPSCIGLHQFVADPEHGDTIYMRCQNGLIRSQDGGDHWDTISPVAGTLLAADHTQPGRVLWVRDGSLLASHDSGTTWKILTRSITGLPSCMHRLFLTAIMH